ncbi:MAG: Multidrug resistance protein MdtE precursor [Firmicutes bacterium ADurb.Bin373]|nr:MAG: Multidrug resistance protein MdtE precursor [Firmicutes bacterium ADurb.Bin373]
MRRIIFYGVLVIVVFGLAVFYVVEKNKQTAQMPGPRAVETSMIQPRTTDPGSGLAGVVLPARQARLGFQVGGRIQGPLLDEGTEVDEGTTLATLDPADYQAQADAAAAGAQAARAGIDQAAALLDQADAAYQKARLDYERAESLYGANAISRAQFDDACTQLSLAAARYRQAQSSYFNGQGASVADYQRAVAQAGLSMLQLSHTALKAPFKGTILKKYGESGEMASPGAPVYVIGNLDQVKVEVTLAAAALKEWRVGDPVDVTSNDLPGQSWTGEVNQINPAVDTQTGSFLMEIKLDNPGHVLKPGMVARVVSRRQTEATLWIPVGALVKRGSSVTVFVVRDDRSYARDIKTGAINGNLIEVVEGLTPGEELVVRGALYLHDGDPVLRQNS